jgi:hypothetical protein
MTPQGSELATLWFVAQCLKCATMGPNKNTDKLKHSPITIITIEYNNEKINICKMQIKIT